jgi:hypothetical protein
MIIHSCLSWYSHSSHKMDCNMKILKQLNSVCDINWLSYFPLSLTPVVLRRQVSVCRENTFDQVVTLLLHRPGPVHQRGRERQVWTSESPTHLMPYTTQRICIAPPSSNSSVIHLLTFFPFYCTSILSWDFDSILNLIPSSVLFCPLYRLCWCPTVRTWRSLLVLREVTWPQNVPKTPPGARVTYRHPGHLPSPRTPSGARVTFRRPGHLPAPGSPSGARVTFRGPGQHPATGTPSSATVD